MARPRSNECAGTPPSRGIAAAYLREEEARDPENLRRAVLDPIATRQIVQNIKIVQNDARWQGANRHPRRQAPHPETEEARELAFLGRVGMVAKCKAFVVNLLDELHALDEILDPTEHKRE